MTEARFARHAGRGVLKVYWQVRASCPELTGHALYAQVVAKRSGIAPEAARAIVLKAEQSFAEWPKERELSFRDVVAYLVFAEFVRAHPERKGVQADMRRVVAKIIPGNL
ncbi:MAG TPA: hypothetical protein VE046_09185 [Steroidobacteraceae bacterium]|nr:hypothetical protein [Steroidobacteraceae bacterium]